MLNIRNLNRPSKSHRSMDLMKPIYQASLIAQLVKNPPVMQEIPVWLLGQEDPLKKG